MKEQTPPRREFGLTTRLSPERRHAVYDAVVDLSLPRQSFYTLVALSTTIAAYGLLANSTAVVIGAMLVAPLMGPIFGIALGLVRSDRRLLRAAAAAELLGVLLSVALGAAIGLLPLRMGVSAEILARTQPTLYDIVIALASGLAGAYALVDERISPALPGVAIATALVPPLTACGLLLAEGRWDLGSAAFLLFTANFLSIEVAGALVFGLFGIAEAPGRPAATPLQVLGRFWLSLAALLLVTVFMTHTLLAMIAERRLASALETTLSAELRATVGASLSDVRSERHAGRLEVIATVLTPQEFEPPQVAQIERVLQRQVDPDIHLIVRSMLSKDVDRSGPVFVATEERERQAQVARQTQFLATVSKTLNEEFQKVPGARVVDIRRDEDQSPPVVTAIVRAPAVVTPPQVAAAQDALQRSLGRPVRLVVRSILIQEAEAQGYRYQATREQAAREQAARKARLQRLVDLKTRRWLETALTHQLRRRVWRAALVELRFARRNGKLTLFAVVRAPRLMRPAQVRRIERAFRRYVYPETRLVVRSIVGTDVAAGGYAANLGSAGGALKGFTPSQ